MAKQNGTKLIDRVAFNLERETKGAVRYQEDAAQGFEKIGTLYIRKTTFGKPEYPKVLHVTIETA